MEAFCYHGNQTNRQIAIVLPTELLLPKQNLYQFTNLESYCLFWRSGR